MQKISGIQYINQDKIQEEKKSKDIRIFVLSSAILGLPKDGSKKVLIQNHILEDEFVAVYEDISDIPVVITNFIVKYTLDKYGTPSNILLSSTPLISSRGHENYEIYLHTEHEIYLFKVYFTGIENSEPIKKELLKITNY